MGRRWNLDPKPNPAISDYACFGNNPILNVDINGDSLNNSFKQIGQKEGYNQRALKAFFKTSEGFDYLSKFAAKGQKLFGHTFTADGEYHKKGIDLNFTDIKFTDEQILNGSAYPGSQATIDNEVYAPNGETNAQILNGRLKLTVRLNMFIDNNGMAGRFEQDYNKALKNGDAQSMDNVILNKRAQTLIHEIFIHGSYYVSDFQDDHKLNVSAFRLKQSGYQHDHWTEKQLTNQGVRTLWNTQGFGALIQINKATNSGWDDKTIYSNMWKYSE